MNTTDDWQHLKPYGYAPGGYMGRCHQCNEVKVDLDKRAITCRPCAAAMHAERQQLPVVERCKCGYPVPCAQTVPVGFCKA
jgi:hypothetical protein